jgi:hypothetical protein
MRWEDIMPIILPPRVNPQTGKVTYPHITSNGDGGLNDFGWRFVNGKWEWHWGVDFNYGGGQWSPLNRDNPPVYSPVTGKVINVDDKVWGQITIEDYR